MAKTVELFFFLNILLAKMAEHVTRTKYEFQNHFSALLKVAVTVKLHIAVYHIQE